MAVFVINIYPIVPKILIYFLVSVCLKKYS